MCAAQDHLISPICLMCTTFVLSLTQIAVVGQAQNKLAAAQAASLFCACLLSVHVFGIHRPTSHDSSLYLFVLVLFHEAVVSSQVHVTLDIFYQHIVSFIGVLSTTITFVFAMFILIRIRLLSSDSSFSFYYSYCGVSVHKNMPSATRRLVRNSPSIFTPYSPSLTF